MNLPLFIAKRYFFTRTKASFITFISRISMIGVGVEVMALILILSVFNGLEDFQKGLFRTYDPDLKIIYKEGTRFRFSPQQFQQLQKIPEITFVNPVLEDQALIRYGGKQLVVRLKGVTEEFIKAKRLKAQVTEGDYLLNDYDRNFGLIGLGVFLSMGMSFEDVFTPIEAWYPNHQSLKSFSINSEAVRSNVFFPGGVLEVEQSFDNQMVIVPYLWMQQLVGSDNEFSGIELMLKNENQSLKIKQAVEKILGSSFDVQTRDEQHAILLKAIKIEKLFVFLIMAFVMGIASFTLFYALSLLVIEKKKDLHTMLAMGISPKQMFQTFLLVGLLISFSGAFLGMFLGFGFAWMQETFGIISLGIPNALIDAYPIKMELMDFIWTTLVVVIITFLASIFPAYKAVQITFKSTPLSKD